MSETTPELRVGDRERRAVDERLQEAVGDGVLTLHEYDERSALLWRARTRSDLDELVADLPTSVPARAPVAATSPTGTRRVVAVMSEDRLTGPVAAGEQVQGYAVMGKAVLDLRRADLPDGVRVQVRSIMGEVEVQVPVGSNVHLSGFTVMGERKVQVGAGDGPVVHVDAVAVMGTVKVTPGDGTVVPALGGASRSATSVSVRRQPSPHGSVAAWHSRAARRLSSAGLAGVLLFGAAGAVASGTDGRAVFGSQDVVVTEQDDEVDLSVLFGSVEVVVEDGVRVDPSGFVPFGGVECDDACAPSPGAPVVELRGLGAFGSIDISTRAEVEAERRAEEREERQERLDDAEEEAEEDAEG